ncbi:MAG: alpha/beta fold hydrolase [Erysipelotrichaceae bacterium]
METKIKLASKADGLALDVLLMDCDKPRGIVQFSHGMAEYKERYTPFMRFLNEAGYICVIHDHRGHGESVRAQSDYGYFYDTSARYIVEDLKQVGDFARETYPGLPHFIFSHSMGTLVSRLYLQQYDASLAGIILCGPPCKNDLVGPGLLLTKILTKTKGDRYRSELMQNMAFGAFSKGFVEVSKNNWLNSDAMQVQKYEADPKCGFVFTTNGFYNLLTMVKRVYHAVDYQVQNKALPIHLIAGNDDPVIGGLKGFHYQEQFMRALGYNDVSMHHFEAMRHEILNEPEHQRVYDDVVAFLEKNS